MPRGFFLRKSFSLRAMGIRVRKEKMGGWGTFHVNVVVGDGDVQDLGGHLDLVGTEVAERGVELHDFGVFFFGKDINYDVLGERYFF